MTDPCLPGCLTDLMEMAADSHEGNNLVEMNASYTVVNSSHCKTSVQFRQREAFFSHNLLCLDLPALCFVCDLNTDLERAHPYDRDPPFFSLPY